MQLSLSVCLWVTWSLGLRLAFAAPSHRRHHETSLQESMTSDMDLKDFDAWMSEYSAGFEEPLGNVKTALESKAGEMSPPDENGEPKASSDVATMYGNSTVPATQFCMQWQISASRDAVLNADASPFSQATYVIDDLVITVKSDVYRSETIRQILYVAYDRLNLSLDDICGHTPAQIKNVTLPVDVHAMLHYENGTFEVNMTKALVAKPIKNSDFPSHGPLSLILLLSSGLFWVLML